ncbi:MAG: hypothetical protein KAV87_10265 [Desulfobacteraceae bacterium]|nr:hypothetical protein [Desulfobacteraceae bacterium]
MSRLREKTTAVLLVLFLAFSVVGFALPVFGNGPIDPPSVEVTLYPGESYEVEKTVTIPEIPPKLDLLLLEDETGSFVDDIEIMQGDEPDCSDGLAAELWDDIANEVDDFQAAVAGFRDFAYDQWGSTTDWVYKLHQDMTNDKDTWLTGICDLTAGGGADGPEAQLAALKSGADGHAWDSNIDGDYDDDIDTPAGEDPDWRDDATKVIVLVTDATYHVHGDPPWPTTLPETWPGPTYAETISELTAEDIHVIVLTTSDYLVTYYGDLATDTGGAVKKISDDSSDIVDAVMEALEEILTDVWGVAECEGGIQVSFDPVYHENVPGGETYSFAETIYVPDGTGLGTYHCTVTFYANSHPEEGAILGVQDIYVTVNPIPVEIDIKPDSDPNSINTKNKKGVIAVAVFTTDEFDVSDIDHSTIVFGPDSASPAHKNFCAHMEDIDDDGDLDVVYHFRCQDTGLEPGDTEAYLRGETLVGNSIEGYDSVRIVK